MEEKNVLGALSPDKLLTTKETAEALTDEGYPTSANSLATWASTGGGPPFRKFGKYRIYRWGDSLGWARARLSRPVQSTSELGDRLLRGDAPEAA